MIRRAALALAAAALAGCPLPQPLPDYPAGDITPPRILVDGIAIGEVASNSRAVVLVPAGCAEEPQYPLTAQILDTNTIEQVEGRWFVNYHPSYAQYSRYWLSSPVPPDPNPLVLTRTVPPDDPVTGPDPFVFSPYQYPPPAGVAGGAGPPYPEAGIVRVVELVVSNGFDPAGDAAPLPFRTALPEFETQVYRWVFLSVQETTGQCEPTDPVCVKCPSP